MDIDKDILCVSLGGPPEISRRASWVVPVTQSLGIAGEDQFIENKNTKQKSYKSNGLKVL